MKQPLRTTLLAGAALLGATSFFSSCNDEPPPAPKHYVVAVALNLSAEIRADISQRLQLWIGKQLPSGSALDVIDAYSLEPVCSIKIPPGRLGDNLNTRMKAIIVDLDKMDEALQKGQEQARDVAGRGRLPQFLEHIGRNLHAIDGAIFVGNPLYLEGPFSMWGGYCPNDAHLPTSGDVSDYGVEEKTTLLKGITVHIVSPLKDADIYDSDAHRYAVTRFWHLYTRAMSGETGYYGHSLDEAIGFATNPAGFAEQKSREPAYQLSLKEDEQMMMVKIDRDTPAWLVDRSAGALGGVAKSQRMPAQAKFSLGVRWDAPVDLDLYVRPAPGKAEVFYACRISPELEHHGDVRSGEEQRWEYVESRAEVQANDLRQMKAYINFYSGNAPAAGVECEARLVFGEKVYARHLVLAARAGNRGRDRDGNRQSGCWAEIPISEIMGLP